MILGGTPSFAPRHQQLKFQGDRLSQRPLAQVLDVDQLLGLRKDLDIFSGYKLEVVISHLFV